MKEAKHKIDMRRYFVKRALLLLGILAVVFVAIFIRMSYMVRVSGCLLYTSDAADEL